MCVKFLLETVRAGTKNGHPALDFIPFNPALFSEGLIQLLHCVLLNK